MLHSCLIAYEGEESRVADTFDNICIAHETGRNRCALSCGNSANSALLYDSFYSGPAAATVAPY